MSNNAHGPEFYLAQSWKLVNFALYCERKKVMKTSVIIRFLIIGLIWAGVCGILVTRMVAPAIPFNLMTLFPLIASGICVFVPLYKKYIRNDKQR